MDTKNVLIKADKASLLKFRNGLEQNIIQYNELLKKCMRIVDDTSSTYRSSSGEYFRENSNDYLLNCQKFVENDVNNLIPMLDSIIAEYSNMYDDIVASIDKGSTL